MESQMDINQSDDQAVQEFLDPGTQETVAKARDSLDLNNIKSTMIGGYNKESVLQYIRTLVNVGEFENNKMQEECLRLKNEYDKLKQSYDQLLLSFNEVKDSFTRDFEYSHKRDEKLEDLLKKEASFEAVRLHAEEKSKDMIVKSKQQTKSLINDAQIKAQEILYEAQKQSDELISNAKKQSEGLVSDAKTRADKIISDAKAQIKIMTGLRKRQSIMTDSDFNFDMNLTNLDRVDEIRKILSSN